MLNFKERIYLKNNHYLNMFGCLSYVVFVPLSLFLEVMGSILTQEK